MSSTKDFDDLPFGALEAVEALRWWMRAGVSDALDDAPHDRFAGGRAEYGDEGGAPDAAGLETPGVAGPVRNRVARPSKRPRGRARPGRRRKLRARACGSGERPRDAALHHGGFRRLRIEADGDATGVRGRRAWLAGHACRRGPGSGGRSNRAPLCRQGGAIARPDAERDRTRPAERLYRQCRSLAPSRQSNPDAAGDADLSALPRAPD